jgi:hypothetical protein
MSTDTAPTAAELLAKFRATGDDGEALQLLKQLLQLDTPDSASRPVRKNPGASLMSAAIYRTAIQSLLELLENAEGAGAKRFSLWVEPVAGQLMLMFCDDGHGVKSNSIERVIDDGCTNGQLAQQRELNRMFHHGLVVCLDSVAADSHLFSLAKDGPLQVVRYGQALTSQLEERRCRYDLGLETVPATFDSKGKPMRDGRPASDKVKELLINGSAYTCCDDLYARIMGTRAKCGVAADAPCFGGMIVLKTALNIASSHGDLVQGEVSLRAAVARRYLPDGVVLSGVSSPRCELILQGEPVEKQSWKRGTMAYSTRLKRACPELGYDMELLLGYKPLAAAISAVDRQATTRHRPPTQGAVLAGSNIVVDVASPFPLVEQRFFEQLAVAGWSRRQQRDNREGQLSGYERSCFMQLAAMAAGKEQVGNATDSLCAFIAADGSAITGICPRTVVKKAGFIQLNKEMRAVMGGEGVTAIVVITPRAGTVPNPADLLSPDKMELTNVQLKTAARTFLHQALLHCAKDAFEAIYPDRSPLWNAVIQEREAAAQAAREAEEQERRAAEVQRAARAAAALAAQADALKEQQAAAKRATAEAAAAEKQAAKAEQRERDAKRKRDDEAHAKLAERHVRRNAQQADAAAAVTAAADGDALRRSLRNGSGVEEMEVEKVVDDAAARDDNVGDNGAGRAAAAVDGRAAGGGASDAVQCCQYCRSMISGRAAADAKRRLDEDLEARVAAKEARIHQLEALVRIMQGRE